LKLLKLIYSLLVGYLLFKKIDDWDGMFQRTQCFRTGWNTHSRLDPRTATSAGKPQLFSVPAEGKILFYFIF
jgi:hypothetical protein